VARVFVSYASEDLELAREVGRWLDADSHDVFLARDDIAVGDQWEPQLYAELRKADAMVCVVTASYLASTGLPVRFETGTNYAAILKELREGKIDVASLGPYTYVLAKQQGAPITVVAARVAEKGEPPTYLSYGITWMGSPIKNLADFRAKRILFRRSQLRLSLSSRRLACTGYRDGADLRGSA
jgi:hypothetical protein